MKTYKHICNHRKRTLLDPFGEIPCFHCLEKKNSNKRSKYWLTMVNILDGQFPKHGCKERGRALVMLSYIEMMIEGWQFGKDGRPLKKGRIK